MFEQTEPEWSPVPPDFEWVPEAPASPAAGQMFTSSARHDSLERALARIAIACAEVRVSETSLWRRAIPRIQVGAAAGVSEIVFRDPSGGLVIPRDSYRISATLSIQDLVDCSGHSLALLQLSRAKALYALLLETQAEARAAARRKCLRLDHELSVLRARLLAASAILEYTEILFSQGRAAYQSLQRSRLSVSVARNSIEQIEQERKELAGCITGTPSRVH
jgi:outer membrane protein TolC